MYVTYMYYRKRLENHAGDSATTLMQFHSEAISNFGKTFNWLSSNHSIKGSLLYSFILTNFR